MFITSLALRELRENRGRELRYGVEAKRPVLVNSGSGVYVGGGGKPPEQA